MACLRAGPVNAIEAPQHPYTITVAPRIIKSRIVIGNSGADRGVRGYVSAYDPENGKRACIGGTLATAVGLVFQAAGDALLPLGMPKFADELKESDVDLLYEYLVRGLHNKKIDAQWY